MKTCSPSVLLRPGWFLAGLLAGLLCATAHAALQTQTLNLAAGWNAIWLEVEPLGASGQIKAVEEVFNDPAITIVAMPEHPSGSAEFIADPTAGLFNQEGWRVWRRSSELQIDTLAVTPGRSAYLVFVEGAVPVSLSVTGQVRFALPQWTPDAFNLMGFGLLGPVSFADFFGAAGGQHPLNRIFRLEPAGHWAGVRPADLMQPGRAYWIYSDGPSDFSGPVKIRFEGTPHFDYGDAPATVEVADPNGSPGDTILLTVRELTLSNVSGSGQNVTLRKIAPAADDLVLYDVVPRPESLDYQIGANGAIADDTFSIPAAGSEVISLGAHRNWSSGARERENLYRIELAHNYFWFPVLAANADLSDASEGAPNSQFAGLWVGEAVLDTVTSLTEPGRPVAAAASRAPLRLILHVNAAGQVSLLSHVMVMQTRAADASVPPAPVLVVNEAKIPFFEGIQERGGHRVGRRIETVAYDMPRRMDPATQAALVDDTVGAFGKPAGLVTAADIASYVNGQASRPVELVESYHMAWPLQGSLGPNAILRTPASAPLLLDPFHRSNPFRHAFHPQHVAGFPVERALTLTFDSDQAPGEQRGRYQETLTGLAAAPVTLSGSLWLRRISEVEALQ